MVLRESVSRERQQLAELLREVFGSRRQSVPAPAKRRRCHGVCARSAADPQVDASRVERLQHPEGLHDLEGSVVREHDPTRAHPDPLGRAGDVADHDLR